MQQEVEHDKAAFSSVQSGEQLQAGQNSSTALPGSTVQVNF